MRRNLTAMPMVAALAAALGMLAAACGGGDDAQTLEEYLRLFDAMTDRFDEDLADANADVNAATDAAETEAETVVALKLWWEKVDGLYAETLADIGELEPPPEAEEQHLEFLAVEGEGRVFVADINERAQLAASVDELRRLSDEFSGPDATEITQRSDAACVALQALADDNEIDADLECES